MPKGVASPLRRQGPQPAAFSFSRRETARRNLNSLGTTTWAVSYTGGQKGAFEEQLSGYHVLLDVGSVWAVRFGFSYLQNEDLCRWWLMP